MPAAGEGPRHNQWSQAIICHVREIGFCLFGTPLRTNGPHIGGWQAKAYNNIRGFLKITP